MISWQVSAVIAACCIGAHYSLLRAASGKLGDTLGAFLLEASASVGILLYFAVGPKGAHVETTRSGAAFSVASGIAISAASILLFYTLRRGGPVGSTGTIVMGGGVALSALLAPWLFGEPITVRRSIGVLLGLLAVVVLATDSEAAPTG